MRTDTREFYNELLTNLAEAYGVPSMDHRFSVDLPQETDLNNAIQESSDFLQMITMAGVTDSKGQALQLGVDGLLAKRTDVSSKDRQPKVLGSPTGSKWEVAFTEFDVAIPYQLLDQWARYPDFAERYMRAVYRAIALDRITIGWHGVSATAGDTDSATNPLGQDVNRGWLQILAEENPSHYLQDAGGGVVRINPGVAAGAGYKSVDAAVADLYSGIAVEHRTGNEVAVVGSDLVAADSNKVYSDHSQTPTEKKEIKTMMDSYGGLPSMGVPRFPTKGIFVGDPSLLHLYFQESGTRRNTEEESKRNRVVDYISSNDAYAIGNTKAVAAVDPTRVTLTLPS